ncbi:MAG: dTDP-4-dehydrorhamnose reductase [Candidatus Falkowbacteria bacterium]|nr:dTDP-4-dehydrorhamnose reductase [Candidatus Falkowbacteria bacterium]
MVILILGAAGNLGTAFRELLSKQEDVSVVAWDKTELDVTDQGILAKKISDIKPNIIINNVAYNDVDACEKDEAAQEIARRLNIDLVSSLADITLAMNATLIHYSSDYVFKGDDSKGYKEDDVPAPQNFYGETKYEGEQELIKLSGKGLKWYLIRTSKLFGPKGSSPSAKPNFFEIMKNLAAEGKIIKAVDDEVGSFTYTRDLAKASWDLIDENCAFGVYHLVNDGQASWYEAAKYFLNKIGQTVDITAVKSQDFPRPAKRPNYSILLNTKRQVLRSWQAAIDDYINQEK